MLAPSHFALSIPFDKPTVILSASTTSGACCKWGDSVGGVGRTGLVKTRQEHTRKRSPLVKDRGRIQCEWGPCRG